MTSTLDPLVCDLVEWVAKEQRSYDEVMEAWRTSCPRLTVWEEAVDRGFVECRHAESRGVIVLATAQGLDFVRRNRPPRTSGAAQHLTA